VPASTSASSLGTPSASGSGTVATGVRTPSGATTRRTPSGRGAATKASTRTAPPVLVRQIRGDISESEHRGHVVEVDAAGRIVRVLGDPDKLVTLRSSVKPFGVVALIEAGGVEAFDLSPAEIAIMTSSHSGEDLHVRTLQSVYRRAGVTQALLACGTTGMPLDGLTAARLARDGERPSPIRHMCSGQHSVFILLARLRDWPLETYWQSEHPAHVAYKSAVARAFGVKPEALRTAADGCGVLTYAFPLRDVARAYALLADPGAMPAGDPRHELAPALTTIRDAMLAHPEMVGGNRDRLDTSVMKALPERVVSKSGMEGLRGIAILPGPRATGGVAAGSGIALKIEDGDGHDRASWAVTVEALRQAGVAEGAGLRELARYHRPSSLDSHGRVVAESVPEFDLAPVGELFA
jgi:L-asparaginase II